MKTIKTKIKGMSFVLGKDWSLVVASLKVGDDLQLLHEEENTSDPCAISIWKDKIKLGYISKELSWRLFSQLNNLKVKVLKITGQNWGVNIEIIRQ